MKILGHRVVEYLTTCDKCNTILSFNEEEITRGGFLNLCHGFVCPTCGKFQYLSCCVIHTEKIVPPSEE